MLIAVLGSIGLGLVWGWLIGGLGGRVYKPLRTVPAVSLATLILAAEVFFATGRYLLLPFLAATFLSLLLHLGWRQELRRRRNPST